jgi:hypothetical protein
MIHLEVDSIKAQGFLHAKIGKVANARPALRKVQYYVISRIAAQFKVLRKGGVYRGVRWADLQGRPGIRQRSGISTRGAAFGGYREGVYGDVATHKIRGGIVTGGKTTLGALRPSGKRVTASSAVMVDTGTMLRKTGRWIKRLTANEIVFGINLKYAGRQNKMRPFLFFELPKDLDKAREICLEHFKR